MFRNIIDAIRALNEGTGLRYRHGKVEFSATGIIGILALLVIILHWFY